jgi:hypothetical protein
MDRTNDSSPQDCPGFEGARDLNWSHPTCSDHRGDQVPNVPFPQVHFGPAGTSPLAANIDHSPTLEGEPGPRASSTPSTGRPPTWGCQWQEDQNRIAAGHHHGYEDSQLHVDTSDRTELGGKIVSPRLADRTWYARKKNKSCFDLAGLAHIEYHIGDDGVKALTEWIIHNCGYKSIHADHPDDILLCFNEIILIHKVVVQGWHNPRTQFCGPVVEYILEKALPVFPCLHTLDVADAVEFYD